ncbi:MAG TPA: tetraacyldisaccharide 4'-kinase [Gemmatimonadaceae bacterium]|nr:tetraacyldisaccharide 4'-kinase [Gemmatimonadaceae bacterium]
MTDVGRVVERIWLGNGIGPATVRAALWPLELLYGGLVAARGVMYDQRLLPTRASALPAISVGNLTVGGTGKTPVAAWIAGRLGNASAKPAIVLRGYGEDEVAVHRALNPGVPVLANVDRAAAIQRAAWDGADVAVLDDGFQHRQIARVADLVLLSVEQLLRPRRLIPAGPWRERLESAARADLVILTRKSASTEDAARARALVALSVPVPPIALVQLVPDVLVDARTGEKRPLELRGVRVHAIAAVGEPELFRRQLEQLGAEVSLTAFPDHHAFTASDIAALARAVPADGAAICTLKDAVKLAQRWPGPSRLWYVSQQLLVEQGQEDIDRLLQRVLDARVARASTPSTPG